MHNSEKLLNNRAREKNLGKCPACPYCGLLMLPTGKGLCACRRGHTVPEGS